VTEHKTTGVAPPWRNSALAMEPPTALVSAIHL
jgi:hypothetical protein